MEEYKRIDREFRWWLASVCSRDASTRLKDAGDFYNAVWRYDEKLDALVSDYGMEIGLSEKNAEGKWESCYCYRLRENTLELIPYDIEDGKMDDGDPPWCMDLVMFQKVPFPQGGFIKN